MIGLMIFLNYINQLFILDVKFLFNSPLIRHNGCLSSLKVFHYPF